MQSIRNPYIQCQLQYGTYFHIIRIKHCMYYTCTLYRQDLRSQSCNKRTHFLKLQIPSSVGGKAMTWILPPRRIPYPEFKGQFKHTPPDQVKVHATSSPRGNKPRTPNEEGRDVSNYSIFLWIRRRSKQCGPCS